MDARGPRRASGERAQDSQGGSRRDRHGSYERQSEWRSPMSVENDNRVASLEARNSELQRLLSLARDQLGEMKEKLAEASAPPQTLRHVRRVGGQARRRRRQRAQHARCRVAHPGSGDSRWRRGAAQPHERHRRRRRAGTRWPSGDRARGYRRLSRAGGCARRRRARRGAHRRRRSAPPPRGRHHHHRAAHWARIGARRAHWRRGAAARGGARRRLRVDRRARPADRAHS